VINCEETYSVIRSAMRVANAVRGLPLARLQGVDRPARPTGAPDGEARPAQPAAALVHDDRTPNTDGCSPAPCSSLRRPQFRVFTFPDDLRRFAPSSSRCRAADADLLEISDSPSARW
jgi:hypothetical protein